MAELTKVNGRAHLEMKRSFSVRIFEKVWGDPPSNTCKFFWGYVGMPIGIAIWLLLIFPIMGIVKLVDGTGLSAWIERKQKESAQARFNRLHEDAKRKLLEADAPPVEKKPKFMSRVLNKITDSMSTFWFKFGAALRWLGVIIGILLVVAVVVLVVGVAATWPGQFFIYLGIGIAYFAVCIALGFLLHALARYLGRRSSKREGPGFWAKFRHAAHLVHNNTCAEIKYEDKK